LWGYSQKAGTSENMLYLYDVSNGTLIDEFDMLSILTLPIPGTDIAGGLYMHEDIVPGTWTLGGLVQNVCLWGVEMGLTEEPILWLSVDPTSGSVAGGEMDEIDVTASTFGFPDKWGFYATIVIEANDLNVPMFEVPVDLYIYDPPPPPNISINPNQFYFEMLPNQQQTQDMVISNTGISLLNFSISINYQNDKNDSQQWLTCEPTSGSVQYFAPVPANLTVDTEGLEKDTTSYSATIIISSNAANVPLYEVPVALDLITSVNEGIEDTYIMMYPNPATDKINISSNYEIRKLILTNQLGQVVLEQQANSNSIQVNASQLRKGIYFVKVNSIAGESTHKLVIQ